MAEWFNVLFGLLATFGVMCLFCMIMSIAVMLNDLEKKESTHSPSRLFADELNEALKENDTNDK